MTTDLKLIPVETAAFVYIRHIDAGEVRRLLPPDALVEIESPHDLFVVASADGVRLAIVEGREAAFAAARAHDLQPLSVH